MKTPLLVANDSRDESREKDSWGTNLLLKSEAPTAAVKRPGLTLTYDGTTTGQGVFIWPEYGGSTVVTIEDDELTFPVVVEIGDLIDGYYAMVENPPTSPGPGDDYWSLSAPDSRRYQAWSRLEVDVAVINSPAYWATQGWTSGAAGTDCACTTRLCSIPESRSEAGFTLLAKKLSWLFLYPELRYRTEYSWGKMGSILPLHLQICYGSFGSRRGCSYSVE